ncbi:MAG: DUF1122 family protein [Acidobacteriota bacterium]|nr:DUF1122 family protein [Acidobacteriota bacterium]
METPLAPFEGLTFTVPNAEGVVRLVLTDWKPLRLSGWRGFRIQWTHEDHPPAEPPLLWGIYSYGGRGVAPWADMAFHLRTACPACSQTWVVDDDTAIRLFQIWATLIPPYGHVAIEYESPGHHETLMSLQRGCPPVTTPIGFWTYMGGFRGGFKDWYISEGGHEGPRKLQANQAADADHAERVRQAMTADLQAFIKHTAGDTDEWTRRARDRAIRWLSVIRP